jgi:hypothetical protein
MRVLWVYCDTFHTSSPTLLLLLGEGRKVKEKEFPLSLVKERLVVYEE